MNRVAKARLTKAIIELNILKANALYKAIPWYRRLFTPKPDLDKVTADAYAYATLIIDFHKNRRSARTDYKNRRSARPDYKNSCLPEREDAYNVSAASHVNEKED